MDALAIRSINWRQIGISILFVALLGAPPALQAATSVPPGQLGMATPYAELVGRSDAEMNAELADYRSLGVKLVRFDFWWSSIQPQAGGSFNWSHIDRVVDACAANGIKVVALLNGHTSYVMPGMSRTIDQEDFAKFARAAATRYKGKIEYYEIFNEPNMASSHQISPASYASLLKKVYPAIKAVDSNALVITAGTAAIPSTTGGHIGAADYLRGIYSNGGGSYFDAVAFHPYTYPLLPSNPASYNGWTILTNEIRPIMLNAGDGGKKIWITELGAPTQGGSNALSEASQAQVIQQAHDLAKTYSYAGPILWYSYKDRGGSTTDTENWFGILRPDGSHKPSYTSFQRIATSYSPSPASTPAPTPAATPAPSPSSTPAPSPAPSPSPAPTASPIPGINLLSNSGFESGLTGWKNNGNSRVVIGQGIGGSRAVRTGRGGGGVHQSVSGKVFAGRSYRLTASARIGNSTDRGYVGIKFYDSSGAVLYETSRRITSTSLTTMSTIDVTVPAGAARGEVFTWKTSGRSYLYVDNVTLTPN